MGGRGASSGISDSGKAYGTEYTTVLKHGNVKFVKDNNERGVAPFETKTKGRVYVTVNKDDKLKNITYYDTDGRRRKTIDFTHYHQEIKPHAHHGYIHDENDGPKGATRLTPKEKRLVERVTKLWYDKHGKS